MNLTLIFLYWMIKESLDSDYREGTWHLIFSAWLLGAVRFIEIRKTQPDYTWRQAQLYTNPFYTGFWSDYFIAHNF